jgi:high-affinity iron transporter
VLVSQSLRILRIEAHNALITLVSTMRMLAVTLLLLGFAPGVARAEPAEPVAASWQRAVGVLQYLSSDYPAAVTSKDPAELAEQQGLVKDAEAALLELGPAGQPFRQRLSAVAARVAQGTDPEGVARDCRTLVDDMAKAGGLRRSPRAAPDLANGARLYQGSCAICHAADGSGRTAAAAGQEPPPADLRSAVRMGPYTAYRAFNVLALGVEGTAMPSYPTLSEDERWALSFYVLALRQPACKRQPPRAPLELLANATDADLAAEYGAAEVPCLRRVMPRADEDEALAATLAGVTRARGLGASGDFQGARQELLDTYLKVFEPVEPALRARHPALVTRFEDGLLRGRVLAERRDTRFSAEMLSLQALLEDAARSRHSTPQTATVFWLALLVVVREGFEVVIVIAALLAVLKKVGQLEKARLVHAGWVTALVAGALCFIFGRKLLAGVNREVLEGAAGLLASAMLVYAALWLNAKSNLRRYMGELRGRMQGALGRSSGFGLFAISFTALFRESFETAVFLEGLSVDSPRGALLGAGAGLVVMAALVLLIRRVGYVLPMKPLFTLSTWVLYGTAVVLLGQGLHAFQETGLLPLVPVRGPRLDMLGLFPDALTLVPQLALALAPLALFFFRRHDRPGAAPLEASGPHKA